MGRFVRACQSRGPFIAGYSGAAVDEGPCQIWDSVAPKLCPGCVVYWDTYPLNISYVRF
jgi:hypothetical protein